MMLEDGFETHDYSPEDLERYNQLKADQERFVGDESFYDKATDQYSQQWTDNWTEYEKLRNRYNGMPPRQHQKPPL